MSAPRTRSSLAIALPIIVSLVAGIAACGKAADTTTDTSAAKTASVGATPAAVSDTAGCGFIPKMAHADSNALLVEFLKRDGEGEFSTSSAWRDTAMACPAQAPGWDGLTLVSSVTTSPLSSSADTVRVLVTYKRTALLEQDSAGYMIKPDVGEEIDTLKLGRSAFGWRIADWDKEPHLLPVGALKLPTLKAADRKKLTQEINASNRAR